MIRHFCENPKTRNFSSYADYLSGYVLSMYKWDITWAPAWVPEWILTRRGTMGIFRAPDGGAPILAAGAYAGAPTMYDIGDEYIGTTLNGITLRGHVGDDVAVIWNNLTLTPDTYTISAYAERLAELDKSILNVIKGARITSLITATDNTDKTTLDNVVKSIDNGDICVKIPPAYREIDALDSGAKRFDILRITDPKDVDKLQYLSRCQDDVISKFFQEYGLDVDMINKGAQVSRDELHSMGDATNAIVQQRLDCRARGLDIVRSWGYDIGVAPNTSRGTAYPDTMPTYDSEGDNYNES